MATASVPNVFTNGSIADAPDVNGNFNALVNFLNASVLHRDGSTALSGALNLGGNRVTNLGAATGDDDAVSLGYVNTGLAQASPKGTIIMFPELTTLSPDGWFFCGGSAVSRTTYDELFAVIGTLYGVGDGSTTFNLPNLGNRFVRGTNSSGAVGTTGGADSHTHTGPSHTHTNPNTSGSVGTDLGLISPDDNNYNWSVTSSKASHVHTQGATGSSGTGNTGSTSNLPAYMSLRFLIRAF
jgi:microcystin-dependent protein